MSEQIMEQLLDTELDVTLSFGERQMLLKDIVALDCGSVVEFNQPICQDVELLVGGKLFARGEVVVVDGNYGLRVTQILGSHQREKLLIAQSRESNGALPNASARNQEVL